MAAKKARKKITKAPSKTASHSDRRWAVKQGRSRAVVRGADMAAARARAAAIGFSDPDSVVLIDERKPNGKTPKAKAVKRPARKAATKRKANKTVIKAKRVTILNLKKNPAFEILKEATPATKGSQFGWKLGKSFYAKGRGQAKLPGGALLDLGSGFVYRRVANPKKAKNGFDTPCGYCGGPDGIARGGGHSIECPRYVKPKRKVKTIGRKKKNIAGFMQDGVFHPIRSGVEQRTTKSGVRRVKSKKAYKPSKVGEKRTYSAKKAAKRGVQSRRMTAATKQRKATTTRLASRLLDRSGPKKTRRNPNTYIRYHVFLENAYGVKSSGKWAVTIAEARQEARRLARLYDSIGVMIEKVEMSNGGRDERVIERIWHQKPTKRNPNAGTKAAYESFQGKPSTKSTSLNFPNGTPVNVYKLGTLHSITLQSGAVVKPAGSTVWLCADTKGKLHLGTSGERLVNAPKGALGKVKEVEYITTKPHLGDNKPTRYYHELGEETGQKPTLYSDGNGGLLFKGGATYIPADGSGIHN